MSRIRDHWSIGEVLSLLQDEFPEVTISKIRFLESQGLIDPERTPSGYRKFTDADYDRLYWILEQQRDNYLPLRVIRDRLDEGQEIAAAPRRDDSRIGEELPDDQAEEEPTDDGPSPPQVPEGYGASSSGAETVQSLSFSEALADTEGPVPAAGDEPHPVRSDVSNALATAMKADVVHAESVEESVPPESTQQTQPEPAPQDGVPSEDQTARLRDPEGQGVPPGDTTGWDADHEDEAASAPTPAIPTKEDDMSDEPAAPHKPAPRLLGTRSEPPRPVTKTTAEALAPPPRPSLSGSSVALTRDELAEQSGSTPGMIAELEKHGMLSPRMVGSAVLFDSTALTIARLAVQFGRFGLEPRHLRTFRLGAEREVALLTQSIGPTLKANNPETRRRSFETLQDLAELSASLRSIIVRDLVADLEPGG